MVVVGRDIGGDSADFVVYGRQADSRTNAKMLSE